MTRHPELVPVRGTFKGERLFDNFAMLPTEHNPGSRLTKHCHDGAFFTVVIRGSYYETCRGINARCDPDSVRYLSPGDAHSNNFGAGCLCLNVHISSDLFSQLERSLRGLHSGEIRHSTAQTIGRRLWADFNLHDNLTEFAALAAIYDLAGLTSAVKLGRNLSPPAWRRIHRRG
jgi:hypothetical protein